MNYSIKIVDGHHVVDMDYKQSELEIAIQRSIISCSHAIKTLADGLQECWGEKR